MGNRKCSIDEFAAALGIELQEYSDKVTEEEKKAVDVVSKEVNDTIKEHITFKQHSGDYVKAFRLKTTEDTALSKKKTWYVKAPQYRLTHLLEKGHALEGGGRAKAFPHIEYGQELAEKRMMELSEEGIENAGH